VHNLPERLTSFVGRNEEIEAIRAFLAVHRLVTVTGSGGVGKTRAAVEVARQLLSDGQEEGWLVDLSPIADGAFVAGAIASILEVPLAQVADPVPSLAAGLKARNLLLMLDNCEHVINDAAAAAGAILRSCPGISILATSRERLAIEGEVVYRLPSLPLPETAPATPEEARASPALQLFIDRAIALESRLVLNAERLAAVAEICRRLEGIPLAIELAATRLPTLGFEALNKRLREHFVLESGARDLPQRQRTMLATIAWSYDLLNEQEQMLLRRLAIFRGGANLEAAEDVCADETLAAGSVANLLSSLVDKSLLTTIFLGEQSRFTMLEAVRDFATARLRESSEFAPTARAHADWMAAIADRAHECYNHVAPSLWLREFGGEIDNVRGALEWALSSGTDEDAVLAGRIVGGLRGLWVATTRPAECRRWAAAALSRVDAERYPLIAARLMRAILQSTAGPAVLDMANRAIALFERIGDRSALITLHAVIAKESTLAGAFAEAERAITRTFELADEDPGQCPPRLRVGLIRLRSILRATEGRLSEARVDLAGAATLEEMLGARNLSAHVIIEAYCECVEGNVRRSAELLEASAQYALADGLSPAEAFCDLAAVRLMLGELDSASRAAREALGLARFEELTVASRAVLHLAAVATLRGNSHDAARLAGFVDAWFERQSRFRGYYERASYDILVASLRTQLSNDAIASLAAEGAGLDFDRAADRALSL
jgi:predicted ATPase